LGGFGVSAAIGRSQSALDVPQATSKEDKIPIPFRLTGHFERNDVTIICETVH
jgi:hypothetical protein